MKSTPLSAYSQVHTRAAAAQRVASPAKRRRGLPLRVEAEATRKGFAFRKAVQAHSYAAPDHRSRLARSPLLSSPCFARNTAPNDHQSRTNRRLPSSLVGRSE
jgi:hypothetical protein